MLELVVWLVFRSRVEWDGDWATDWLSATERRQTISRGSTDSITWPYQSTPLTAHSLLGTGM